MRTSRPLEARAIIGADAARGKTAPVAADAFRIRDPFILADDATKTYYLYETTDPYKGRPYARGVSVRTSKDLLPVLRCHFGRNREISPPRRIIIHWV